MAPHYRSVHIQDTDFGINHFQISSLSQRLTTKNFYEKSTRRRCKHCALAVVRWSQTFRPPQTPFLGAWDGQNLISWRWSLPSPTNPVWRGSMHAISSYRGNRPTNKQTQPHTPTDWIDYNTLRRS